MKKRLFAILFLFISFFASAQSLVLTQTGNEPAIGDTDHNFDLDTSNFYTGMPISVTGTNSVWDFSHFTANIPSFSTSYLDPSGFTDSTAFPACTVVETDGIINTFIKSTTTPTAQTEILGVISNTLSLTFTNSAILAKYPVSFGSMLTDNLAGTFSAFSYTGSCTGNIVTKADGAGTLMLPNGVTLTNVLRVKSVQTLNLSVGFFPVATGKQTVYNFYHSSKKFAVLSINYDELTITASSTTVTAFASGNADLFSSLVGLKNNTLNNAALSVYPNPFSHQLHLEINESLHPSEIRIYNQLGDLIHKQSFAKNITTDGLQAGIYFLEVQTPQSIIRKKLIKE